MIHALKKPAILGMIAAATSSIPAQALPLFGETEGYVKIGTVTLYKDSEDPNKLYFAPNTGRFAMNERNQKPRVSFIHWGLTSAPSATMGAGALLNMTLRMDMDAEMRSVLESLIQQGKRIAVLPVVSSTIEFNEGVVDQNEDISMFFKNVRIPKVSGQPGDDIPVSMTMTELGGKVFLKHLETNGDLLPIRYCYKAQGLGPNFNGRVHVRWKSVYDYLKVSTSARVGWFKRINITRITETLRRNGDVTVTIDGGTAKDEEYMQKIADLLVEKFFVNVLPTSPAGDSNSSGLWSLNIGSVHREELVDMDYVYTRRELTTRDFCPGVGNYDLAPYLSDIIRAVD